MAAMCSAVSVRRSMGRVARRITNQAASAASAMPASAITTSRLRSTSSTSSVSDTRRAICTAPPLLQRRGDHAVLGAADRHVAVARAATRCDAMARSSASMGNDGCPGNVFVTVAVARRWSAAPRRTRSSGRGARRRRRPGAPPKSPPRSPGGCCTNPAARSCRNLSVSSCRACLALTCAAYAPPTTATATITATMTVRRVRRLTTVGPCTRLPARCGSDATRPLLRSCAGGS